MSTVRWNVVFQISLSFSENKSFHKFSLVWKFISNNFWCVNRIIIILGRTVCACDVSQLFSPLTYHAYRFEIFIFCLNSNHVKFSFVICISASILIKYVKNDYLYLWRHQYGTEIWQKLFQNTMWTEMSTENMCK